MKVTIDNVKNIKYIYDFYNIENGQNLLKSLLIDLAELNNMLIENHLEYKQLYIDYIDEHTEYSPERTDPCPDFYGMFTLRFESNQHEKVGDIVTLNELDNIIFSLVNFVEFKK